MGEVSGESQLLTDVRFDSLDLHPALLEGLAQAGFGGQSGRVLLSSVLRIQVK